MTEPVGYWYEGSDLPICFVQSQPLVEDKLVRPVRLEIFDQDGVEVPAAKVAEAGVVVPDPDVAQGTQWPGHPKQERVDGAFSQDVFAAALRQSSHSWTSFLTSQLEKHSRVTWWTLKNRMSAKVSSDEWQLNFWHSD